MNVLSEIKDFYISFKGEKGSIGKSYLKKDIYYFKIKKTDYPVFIVQYGIHAREYITCYLALKQIADFTNHGKRGTVYFIPSVNPDGISIALEKYSLYKSNANGVDLNLNFDARFGSGKTNRREFNLDNFIGSKPFSEKESKLLRDFTLNVKPNLTISYHAKGQEIYFDFHQSKKDFLRDLYYAYLVSKCTGYKIVTGLESSGGYKDWCVEKLKIPAMTIEVGSDKLIHPIKKESLPQIYLENKGVINLLTESFND